MKNFFLVSLLTALSTTAFAQFQIGAHVGPNFSRLRTDNADFESSGARVGFQAGAYARFGTRVFVQPGVDFVRMTSDLVASQDLENPENTNLEDRLNLNAVQIPVLLGVRLLQSRDASSSLNLLGGLSYGYFTRVMDNDLRIEDSNLNRSFFNAQAGLGVDLWFLTFQLTYQHGLTNTLSDVSGSQNRLVAATVGVKFGSGAAR